MWRPLRLNNNISSGQQELINVYTYVPFEDHWLSTINSVCLPTQLINVYIYVTGEGDCLSTIKSVCNFKAD